MRRKRPLGRHGRFKVYEQRHILRRARFVAQPKVPPLGGKRFLHGSAGLCKQRFGFCRVYGLRLPCFKRIDRFFFPCAGACKRQRAAFRLQHGEYPSEIRKIRAHAPRYVHAVSMGKGGAGIRKEQRPSAVCIHLGAFGQRALHGFFGGRHIPCGARRDCGGHPAARQRRKIRHALREQGVCRTHRPVCRKPLLEHVAAKQVRHGKHAHPDMMRHKAAHKLPFGLICAVDRLVKPVFAKHTACTVRIQRLLRGMRRKRQA